MHGQWYWTEKGPKLMDKSYRRGWYHKGFGVPKNSRRKTVDELARSLLRAR